MRHEIIKNIDLLHTTKLGEQRILKNLCLQDVDAIEWCKEFIKVKATNFNRLGKNFYVENELYTLTIHALSYTIITAHKK